MLLRSVSHCHRRRRRRALRSASSEERSNASRKTPEGLSPRDCSRIECCFRESCCYATSSAGSRYCSAQQQPCSATSSQTSAARASESRKRRRQQTSRNEGCLLLLSPKCVRACGPLSRVKINLMNPQSAKREPVSKYLKHFLLVVGVTS